MGSMKNSAKLLLLSLALLMSSCGDYQKVLKSNDPDYKFRRAVEYFEAEKYDQAYPLFDELLVLFRGTEKAAQVYYYYAETSFRQEDYILAAYHFKNFAKTFPNHEKAEEAYFKVGLSHYYESPEPSLDQAYTYKAINDLQLFTNLFPQSDKLAEANRLTDELRAKLERKAFEKARQYFVMEQFQAAVVSFNNVLDEFPGTVYQEEAMFYRAVAAFRLAENSIQDKQLERYIECRTSTKEFLKYFSESDYRLTLQQILEDTETAIADLDPIS